MNDSESRFYTVWFEIKIIHLKESNFNILREILEDQSVW